MASLVSNAKGLRLTTIGHGSLNSGLLGDALYSHPGPENSGGDDPRDVFASAASHFSSLGAAAPAGQADGSAAQHHSDAGMWRTARDGLQRAWVLVTQHPGAHRRPPTHELPRHVQLLNAFLCAQCRYPIIPIALIAAWLVDSASYTVTQTGGGMIAGIGNIVEFTVNTVFGFFYWRNQRASDMITHLEPLGVTAQQSIRSLGRFVWAGLVVTTAMVAPRIYSRWTPEGRSISNYEQPWGTAMIGVVGNSWLYGQSFHLCACWLWSCHMYLRAAACIVRRHLSAADVAAGTASKTVFQLLEHMRATSRVWMWNHMFRFFASIALASAWLHFWHNAVEQGSHAFVIGWTISIALALYSSAWATAAYPGYVNKTAIGMVQRKLAQRSSEAVGIPAPVPHGTDLKDADTAGLLMHRLDSAAPYTGMHFAGIPMTLEKAIGAGTVIFWWASQEFTLLSGPAATIVNATQTDL